MSIEDSQNLSRVLSDEESMRYYPKAFNESEVLEWIKWNIESYKRNGFGLWAVIRKSDNRFLGDCGITMQTIDNKVLPEIGFHIIREYCKNGYATEAAKGCIKYAHKRFSIREIYSYSSIENIPSQSVMKKIGMRLEKTYKENGKENIVYSIDAGDI